MHINNKKKLCQLNHSNSSHNESINGRNFRYYLTLKFGHIVPFSIHAGMQECVITVIAIITVAIMHVKQWVKIFYTIVKILATP